MLTNSREYLYARGVPELTAVYRQISSAVGFAPFKPKRLGVELVSVWALVGLGLAAATDPERGWFRLLVVGTATELDAPGATVTPRRSRPS